MARDYDELIKAAYEHGYYAAKVDVLAELVILFSQFSLNISPQAQIAIGKAIFELKPKEKA